jgi:hypothetical protein
VFKAIVEVDHPSLIRKLQIKIKKVFEGRSNFYPEDLERQIRKGLNSWDLGFYSDKEVEELSIKAEKLGINIKFIPT